MVLTTLTTYPQVYDSYVVRGQFWKFIEPPVNPDAFFFFFFFPFEKD